MKKDIATIFRGLMSCAVFRGVLQTDLFERFGNYVYSKECETDMRIDAYADFVSIIYQGGGNLTELVKKLVFEDENVYVKGVAQGQTLDDNILRSAKKELATLSDFASLTAKDFALDMDVSVAELPAFTSFNADMGAMDTAIISIEPVSKAHSNAAPSKGFNSPLKYFNNTTILLLFIGKFR